METKAWAPGFDNLGEFVEKELHRFSGRSGDDDGCAGVTSRANGTEYVGGCEPLVVLPAQTVSTFMPTVRDTAALADPCLISEPKLDVGGVRVFRLDSLKLLLQLFFLMAS